MNADRDLLDEVAGDLVESRKILRAETKKVSKLKGKTLEKENAERALETIKIGVKAIKQQHDALEEKLEE